jgi:polyhydroxybutyrate depolymerase
MRLTGIKRWLRRATLGVLVASPLAQAGVLDGLFHDLQNLSQKLAGDVQNIQQQIQRDLAAWDAAVGKLTGALQGSLSEILANTVIVLKEANGNYLDPTPGTAAELRTIEYQGLARSVLVIRPDPATVDAPALILMHAHNVTPQTMANLARAGRLAAQYGAWIYLPQGVNGKWNEDPGMDTGIDDVGFISRLIDSAVAQDGIDAQRVYAAGYSSGGFMAQRLACQLTNRIAGFASVAATMRNSLAEVCAPSRALPAVFMNGTADLVVPYKGEPGLHSAAASLAFWAAVDGCASGQFQTVNLPDAVNDGTHVALTRYTACLPGTAALLYTIDKGGHTWPGGPGSLYTADMGKTSRNLDATLVLWQDLAPYALP